MEQFELMCYWEHLHNHHRHHHTTNKIFRKDGVPVDIHWSSWNLHESVLETVFPLNRPLWAGALNHAVVSVHKYMYKAQNSKTFTDTQVQSCLETWATKQHVKWNFSLESGSEKPVPFFCCCLRALTILFYPHMINIAWYATWHRVAPWKANNVGMYWQAIYGMPAVTASFGLEQWKVLSLRSRKGITRASGSSGSLGTWWEELPRVELPWKLHIYKGLFLFA